MFSPKDPSGDWEVLLFQLSTNAGSHKYLYIRRYYQQYAEAFQEAQEGRCLVSIFSNGTLKLRTEMCEFVYSLAGLDADVFLDLLSGRVLS